MNVMKSYGAGSVTLKRMAIRRKMKTVDAPSIDAASELMPIQMQITNTQVPMKEQVAYNSVF